MDRLDTIRLFAAIADEQSFAEAARTRRVSPAAASRAVAALENELGVALFRRTTRSVRLTEEGAIYLERCRLALETLEDGARALRGRKAEPRGVLAVTAPVVFGRMHIVPVLGGLLRDNPDLEVRLTLTDRVVRLVDEGIDIAVRIADLSDSSLHAMRIAEVRRVLVANPVYLSRHGTPQNIAQLADHALIAFDGLTLNGEWRFAGARKPAIRIEPRLLTNDVQTAIDAALDGLGIARALSYQVARHLKEGKLKRLLAEFEPPAVPVNLVYLPNRQRSPNVRALLDAARKYFARRAVD